MIADLEETSDGSLTIDDRVMNRIAPKDRDVAMVFQNYALYPLLNVVDSIAFGLRIRRENNEQIGTPMELFLIPATMGRGDTGPIAKFGGQQMAHAPLDVMQNAEGHEIIIGLRPEFVTTVSGDAPGKSVL